MTTAAGINQQITLLSARPPIQVTALRGENPPQITGGYGGWTKVSRPRKRSLTEWDGVDQVEMLVPLLFDGFPDDTVEFDCGRLEQLSGIVLTPVGGRGEPPVLRVIGAVPADRDWVVETLEWTDPVIYHEDGFRVRQGANVTLLEYVADDRVETLGAAEQARLAALQAADAAARKAGVGGAVVNHPTFYTVKQGDSLSSIAARQLGDYRRWPEIADLNNLRDPRRVKPGQVLRLP